MKTIRQNFPKYGNSAKLKSFKPVIDEFTVFIMVNIEILKALSKLSPNIVKMLDKVTREIMKTSTVKKYL